MMVLCGAGLMTFGAGLALRSALLLHGRGRPQRGRTPAFVIAGPYRRIRNPLFGGAILIALGWLAVSQRWSGLVAAAGFALGCHLWVTRHEEPRLRARFGDAYVAYLGRVPRWWPAIGGLRRR
jgi:protein-S-isoprenylcysteine O-methyltransferase Ste14